MEQVIVALSIALAVIIAVWVAFMLGAERVGTWFFDREEEKLRARQANTP